MIVSGEIMETWTNAIVQLWRDVVAMGIFSTMPVLIALVYIALCSFQSAFYTLSFATQNCGC